MKLNIAFAKFLIVVYGLSISGYVLLDSTHELLHTLKNEFHNHGHLHHHHVEDHQDVFTPADKSEADTKSPGKFFSLLLFYHSPITYLLPRLTTTLKGNGLLKKLLTVTKAPLTPPPLG